ncbi:MAG: ABC transporter substrate-binding protein [Geminicoccaceae bacterium]|nr:ABC transporter substrate-binding protein [Geminicoccaceae bacterium]
MRVLLGAAFAVLAGAGLARAEVASGDTSGKRIALSNNFAGNSWRQSMLKSWEETASKAVKAGIVAEAPSFTTAENQATEQAAQIQNMILEGFDAIVVDAASPTALNGTIKEACDAGVVVVSFDGIVTEPCAWRIVIDFAGMGEAQVDYLAKRLPDGGKLLEIRGLAGVSVDDEIHKGIVEGVEKHEGFEIAGSVHGDWTQTVAQREVAGLLPTLPKIDAVVTQGGDGYGAAQAFKAAGRDMPLIIMGNRSDELAWWKAQRDQNGYETMSLSIAPAAAQVGFWTAQQILAGSDVPKDLLLPTLVVEQADLDKWIARTPEGGVTNATYTQEWTAEMIDAVKNGKPVPATPSE